MNRTLDMEFLQQEIENLEKRVQEISALTRTFSETSEEKIFTDREFLLERLAKAYTVTVDYLLSIQSLVSQLDTHEKRSDIRFVNEKCGNYVHPQIVYDEETSTLTCKFLSPPIMKKHQAGRKYLGLVALELEQFLITILPERFPRLRDAYVIYINHFDRKLPPGKQPYYDNDNIAIKGLLDAIVPYLCIDDAACYCDDIYLSQPDDASFTELIVMPKSQISGWMMQRSELLFSKNCRA